MRDCCGMYCTASLPCSHAHDVRALHDIETTGRAFTTPEQSEHSAQHHDIISLCLQTCHTAPGVFDTTARTEVVE